MKSNKSFTKKYVEFFNLFQNSDLKNKSFLLNKIFLMFLNYSNLPTKHIVLNKIFDIKIDNSLISATNQTCYINKIDNLILISCPDNSKILNRFQVLQKLLCVLYIFLFSKKNINNATIELADCVRSDKKIIGFSSKNVSAILIPDHHFIRSLGFAEQKKLLLSKYKIKILRGIWMGALNSQTRLNFYLFSKDRNLNVNFISSKNLYFEKNYEKIIKNFSNGIDFKEKINWHEFLSYLIQIDIEGRAATFSSLFLKLASGYPTIKIQSDYKQWYYDHLHSLPNLYHVKKDFSDFDEVYNKIIQDYNNSSIKIDNSNNFLQNMKFEDEILNAAKKIDGVFGY